MYRASTPTHNFAFPSEYAGKIQTLLITYSQRDKIVLNKKVDGSEIRGNSYSYRLTQEETNLFEEIEAVEIQVRILTNDGLSIPSNIYSMPCERVLNDEVL